MNFFKFKSKVIVCFKKEELQAIFSAAKRIELQEEIINQGFSLEDVSVDEEKAKNIVNIVSEKTSKNTNDYEIFSTIYTFIDFYESGSEICFELKDSFNTSRDKITNLKDLNGFKSDPPDFIIKSSDGFREFELKRYKDSLNTEDLFSFLKKKIEHYGTGLGNANLLLILQSSGDDISNLDFHEINSRLNLLNPQFEGQVLISYNENNRDMVINQVFPKLTTARIPIVLPSER